MFGHWTFDLLSPPTMMLEQRLRPGVRQHTIPKSTSREREREIALLFFNNSRKTTNNPCTPYVAKYIQRCNKGSASATAVIATAAASATASTATASTATAPICYYYCTATTTPSHQTVIIIITNIPSIPIVPIRSLPPACYFIFGMTGLIKLFPQVVF